jgi:hydrogenase-4 component F
MLILTILFIPFFSGIILGLIGHKRHAEIFNMASSLLTTLLSILLLYNVNVNGPMMELGKWFYVDSFNIIIVFLTSFIGFTTAVFSGPYMKNEIAVRGLSSKRLRLFHSLYQIFIGAMLLSLMTNNLGILWIAMEGATLSTVLLISLYRTGESIEAAWKYFILCSVGIAQALLGTILIYFAAGKVLGNGGDALFWTSLNEIKNQIDPNISSIAFVFILIGYGTKCGLVPLHNWLPDAHAEGPTPISAILSGLLLNVALYAIIRCKILIEPSIGNEFPSYALMAFGLLSIIVAAFFLFRQTDIKRLFSYSSIEHMGLIAFAYGIGTPMANFAALLHMTMHSLTKSAIFMAVGHAAQKAGSQKIKHIHGLIEQSPLIGWSLILGSLAILGMPPFGIFTSKFLIITTTINQQAWATPFILVALAVAFAAIFGKVQMMVFGVPKLRALEFKPSFIPFFIHILIVIVLGVYMPDFLKNWYHQAALLIE